MAWVMALSYNRNPEIPRALNAGAAQFAPQCAASLGQSTPEPHMKLPVLFAAAILCAPGAAEACTPDALQQTVSLMVSLGQHGEGADASEAAASLDGITAQCPLDPHVLKAAALALATLADEVEDKPVRIKLREQALADFDRSAALVTPSVKQRQVMLNGQPMAIGFSDNAELRKELAAALAEDR
jgi:hypothetical protein